MNNQEIINLLISIGEKITADLVIPDLSTLMGHGHINCMGPNNWADEVSCLTDKKLIHLLKGITYVERELKWDGGSVAGGVWLFSILLRRNISIDEIDEIAGWVLENTNNTYNPFGTVITLGAKNYTEYKAYSAERNKSILRELERDLEIEKNAKIQRAIRKKIRMHGAQRRNRAEREKLIIDFNHMPVREQLIVIAKDVTYAPNFYPTKCADSAGIDIIKSLPEEIMNILAIKMKGKYRGPWGAFKKRLLSVCDPASKREPWDI